MKIIQVLIAGCWSIEPWIPSSVHSAVFTQRCSLSGGHPGSQSLDPFVGGGERNTNVLFTSYAGSEIKMDGKEYLIMTESDIMAVIED